MLWLVHMIFSKQFSFWRTEAFFLQLCHAHHGCPVSPDGGLMNININQCEKGLYLLRSYQPHRLLHVLLWSDLCWSTTSREGKSSLEFPPFVHNLSDCGFVESKLFRDSFVTFSSLMSNINSFPEVLSNLLFYWHDSLPQTWSDFDRSLFFE